MRLPDLQRPRCQRQAISFLWLFAWFCANSFLWAQDAVNPCTIAAQTIDCSGADDHPAEAEIAAIKLDGKRRIERVVRTDAPLLLEAQLKYSQRAKVTVTTSFTGSGGASCPDRVEQRRLKPEVLVSWSATLVGTSSGTQSFSGSGLTAQINAPPVPESAVLTISYSLAPGAQGCVLVPGVPASRSFELTVVDGPYLTGISATQAAGYNKLAPVPSGTYLPKNSGEALQLQANLAGLEPGFDPNQIQWQAIPAAAGNFIDGNNLGEQVTWRQNNSYVSSVVDEVVITASLPGAVPTKYFLTVVEIGGPTIALATGATVTHPCQLTPSTELDPTALAALVVRLNALTTETRIHSASDNDAAILASASAAGVITAAQFETDLSGPEPTLALELITGSTVGQFWLCKERHWEGTQVLMAARAVAIGLEGVILSGTIVDNLGGHGPETLVGGGQLDLQLQLDPGQSLPAGQAVDWTISTAVPGATLIPNVPTGANSLLAQVALIGQPAGSYEVQAAFNSSVIDSFTIQLEGVDLAVNTHDHPQVAGLPVASSASDIDASDTAREDSLGGYLWVNDDNDNAATANKIDLEDNANFLDNDLEPVRFILPSGGLPPDYRLELTYEAPGSELRIRVWGENKHTSLDPGSYDDLGDFDPDGDGLLWVEGLNPGVVILGLKLLDASDQVISQDSLKLTVFAVERITWADQGTSYVVPSPVDPPSGQTRTGLAIFPDKLFLGDSAVHDQPKRVAAVTPAVPAGSGWHLPLVVRVFDVDHYAKGVFGVGGAAMFDTADSSIDDEGHHNGREPNDNRSGYLDDGPTGAFGEDGDNYSFGLEFVSGSDVVYTGPATGTRRNWAHVVGESGQVEAVVHITEHTPCNNWRAAAALAGFGQWDADRPIRIEGTNNDGETLEYISDDDLNRDAAVGGSGARSTETLTVWRRLYLEQDVMAPVDVLSAPTAEMEPSVYVGDVLSGVGTTHVNADVRGYPANRFQGGTAKCLNAANQIIATLSIQGSSQGRPILIDLNGYVPAATVRIVVASDDVLSFDVDAGGVPSLIQVKAPPAAPDYAPFNHPDSFPAACILVDFDTLNAHDSPLAPFISHADPSPALNLSKTAHSEPGFWVSTHLVAFQYGYLQSGDPIVDGSHLVKGIAQPYWSTDSHPSAMGGFLTFMETMRDSVDHAYPFPGQVAINFPIMQARTAMHECGHTLGGRHTDWGLMQEGNENTINTNPFNGVSLRRFMLLRDVGP